MKRLILAGLTLIVGLGGFYLYNQNAALKEKEARVKEEARLEQVESSKMTYLECKNPVLINYESNNKPIVLSGDRIFLQLKFKNTNTVDELITAAAFHSTEETRQLGELDLDLSKVKWHSLSTSGTDGKKIKLSNRDYGLGMYKEYHNYLLDRETLHLDFDYEFLFGDSSRGCYMCDYVEIAYQCEVSSSDKVDQIFKEMIAKKKLEAKMEEEKKRKTDEEQSEKNKL